MARRRPYEQSCHDAAVRRSALMLQANGWRVKADISGFTRPRKLCIDGECSIPDIIVTKHGETQVIEWETPESVDKDRNQHHILRTYAWRQGWSFHVKVCDV